MLLRADILKKGHLFVSAKKEKERQKMEKERRLQESTQEEEVKEEAQKPAEETEPQTGENEATGGAATVTVITSTTGSETVTISPMRRDLRGSTPYGTPSEKRSTPYHTPSKAVANESSITFATPDGKKESTPMHTPSRATPFSSPFFNRVPFVSFTLLTFFFSSLLSNSSHPHWQHQNVEEKPKEP